MRPISLSVWCILLTSTALVTSAAYGQQAPAAATVPSVNVTATPAKASEAALPVLPSGTAQPAPTVPAKPAAFVSSMGDSELSVFFTPDQVKAMRAALTAFEEKAAAAAANASGTGAAPIDLTVETPEQAKVVEPDTYPVFFLSSIAYESPTEWSIWVSGHKITSHRNNSDLKVLSINADTVTFSWTPTYAEALNRHIQEKTLADTAPVKHKLARPAKFSYDEKTSTLTFTLRMNQSFVVGYFDIFEGMQASPAIGKVDEAKSKTIAIDTKPAPVPSTTPAPASGPIPVDLSVNRKQIDDIMKRPDMHPGTN